MVTIIEILLPSEGILIGFHVLSFWYVEELCSSQDKPAKAEDGKRCDLRAPNDVPVDAHVRDDEHIRMESPQAPLPTRR